jgi:trimethylamine:corrinoid methyltransferase-like protein
MIDRTNWDQWKTDGSKTFRDRAREVIEACLDDYDLEPLDPALHAEIRTLFQTTAHDRDVRLPVFE